MQFAKETKNIMLIKSTMIFPPKCIHKEPVKRV